jgi:hypothetical protein
VRKLLGLIVVSALVVAGCGGGGSSSSTGGGGGGGGSGGGGTGGGQTITPPGPPNVDSIIVDAGPAALTSPAVNTGYTTIKVCVHGTATCQTIDHVQVDTGSVGVRLLADAQLTAGGAYNLALTPVTDTSGHPLGECLQFADGTSWGSVNTADITLTVSGETASNVVVQVIGATSVGSPPAGCTGTPENTVATFGANGILGIGPFINDCNPTGDCAPCPAGSLCSSTYWSCPTPTTCEEYSVALDQQLPNLVTLFGTDNNGSIIELPAVAAGGSTGTQGSLVFGINTRSNNGLGSATELVADPTTGYITATINGTSLGDTYLDSGSNGNFLNDSSLPVCPNAPPPWYCPAQTVNESATLQGTNGAMLAADFSVANANTLFQSTTFTAFPELAGTNPDSQSLGLGLPFFYGRNVYTGIENPETNSVPFFAY